MTKSVPFYQSLNQPPRSMKQHGKHRRTSPKAHGSPADGASNGTGDQSVQVVSINSRWLSVSDPIDLTIRKPEPPTIPYAGIRAGELIGARLWWLVRENGEEWLCSLAHRHVWRPEETVRGDIMKAVDSGITWAIWGGTYAFREDDQQSVDVEIALWETEINDERERRKHGLATGLWWGWNPLAESMTLVRGTIKMWGEVIEHERGYRAEFAKVNSLDAIYGDGDLDELRRKYLVATTSDV